MLPNLIIACVTASLFSRPCMAGVGGNGLQFKNDLQDKATNALDAVKLRKREGCTMENAAESPGFFRASLSTTEKDDYIHAVQCLWDRPSEQMPGFSAAQNLYDDFVATHIQQADTIHSTGRFLTWHHLFIWTWESRLRKECGYEGYLTYWKW
ncbi:monophenol monooxygenase (tyrosinase) [Apiospora sp. TS-2023a]